MALKIRKPASTEVPVYDPASEASTAYAEMGETKVKSEPSDEDYTKAVGAVQNSQVVPQSGGSGTGAVGGSLMAAAPMTGAAAPYMFGAGAALSTYAAIKKKEEDEANAQYLAKLKKIESTQNSLSQLMQASQGLRSL